MQLKQKRSQKIRLSLMGLASATALTACDNGPSTDVPMFTSVEQCAADPGFNQAECQAGMQFALQQQYLDDSPRFSGESSCVAEFGEGQCHAYQRNDQSSVWMPLLGGFLLGQALQGSSGFGRSYYAYNYANGWRSRENGRTRYSSYAPRNLPRPKTASIPKPTKAHTKAITRGGFGARAKRYPGYSFGG
jgi:uncharacterized protein YgiB involved in biofilm formation